MASRSRYALCMPCVTGCQLTSLSVSTTPWGATGVSFPMYDLVSALELATPSIATVRPNVCIASVRFSYFTSTVFPGATSPVECSSPSRYEVYVRLPSIVCPDIYDNGVENTTTPLVAPGAKSIPDTAGRFGRFGLMRSSVQNNAENVSPDEKFSYISTDWSLTSIIAIDEVLSS